jgi:hypothetical protein
MLNEFEIKTCALIREKAALVLKLFSESTWTFLLRASVGCGGRFVRLIHLLPNHSTFFYLLSSLQVPLSL